MINNRRMSSEINALMAFLSVLILCVIPFGSIAAWDCDHRFRSNDEHIEFWYERADAIFVGRTHERYGGWVDVATVWKGTVPPVVYINHATKAKDSSEAVFFGLGPQNDGSYESISRSRCFWMPNYKYTIDYLNRVYGPGIEPREDHFASSWFVGLALMLLMGAGLWVWTVVRPQNSR